MTREQSELDQLQRWMLDAVTQTAETSPEKINELILPSRQQSAGERLAVYRHAYLARLLEVLRELFPCARYAVGDELFDQFATGYLQAHPPHSYSLGHLADNLVEYFDASRPADWGEFLVELTRLERTIERVFDAPGPEDLPPFVMPATANASLRMAFVPGFELLAFRYPVSSFFTNWKAGRQPAWPEVQEQFVALFRRDYVVRRHELSESQYRLLATLQSGASLGDAITAVPDALNLDDAAAEIRRWFATWTATGFFASTI